MAWWQKKLLRFALSRTGLLDDKALELHDFDMTWGKTNVIDLKDVGLNTERISELLQLPPSLRVETARVLALRLMVPADIYRSSIVAEVDGVKLNLILGERSDPADVEGKGGSAYSAKVRSPQHRKVHHRLQSPPPYDPGGSLSGQDGTSMLNTEELAKSFLVEEPVQERKELAASVAAESKGLDESVVSESSSAEDYGTGVTIGLPSFLSGFLQGIVDRLQIHVKNLEARLESNIVEGDQQRMSFTLRLKIGKVEFATVVPKSEDGINIKSIPIKRSLQLQQISVDLLSDATALAELSELLSRSSPTASKITNRSTKTNESQVGQKSQSPSSTYASPTQRSLMETNREVPPPVFQSAHGGSAGILAHEDLAEVTVADETIDTQDNHAELDIQPGDDNISWGSRRREASAPIEDLWNSMVSEDDLPDSLLFEPTSTSRSHSTRSNSPVLSRTHVDSSPQRHQLQSPGTWPVTSESQPCVQLRQSPGSWPNLDESQQSLNTPPVPELVQEKQPVLSNKRTIVETTEAGNEERTLVSSHADDVGSGDIDDSRTFSHEGDESMYMSALSEAPHTPMPGDFNSGDGSDIAVPIQGDSNAHIDDSEEPRVDSLEPPTTEFGSVPDSTNDLPLNDSTPRALSPEPERSSESFRGSIHQSSKQLLAIDTLAISIISSEQDQAEQNLSSMAESTVDFRNSRRDLPGSFSAYSDLVASRRGNPQLLRDEDSFSKRETSTASQQGDRGNSIQLDIGTVDCQFDVSSGRLLYRVASDLGAIFHHDDHVENAEDPTTKTAAADLALSLTAKNIRACLRNQISEVIPQGQTQDVAANGILTISLAGTKFDTHPNIMHFQIGCLEAYVGSSPLLHFSREAALQSSTVIDSEAPDLAIVFERHLPPTQRPTTYIEVQTLPILLFVNLHSIDETLDTFGGLSGILEIGNSVVSDHSAASSPSSPSKSAKGVRFEGEPVAKIDRPELKVNAICGSLSLTLLAEACSAEVQSTKLKAIYREHGASATVNEINFVVRHDRRDSQPPLLVKMTTLRLEFLITPQDKDLERLLSLLTPSKDKYDDDDDILVDTLLRQRKKASIIRVSLTSIEAECNDTSGIEALGKLSNELSRLSAVAKYLPEDERPGILSLIRIKEVHGLFPINDRFGNLHLGCTDFHCSHVGLPLLLALSVSNVYASQNGRIEIVRPLNPLSGSDNLPMVMARMLGNEMEPTVKVKLFNLCIEYNVSVVLDLTSLDVETMGDEDVTELARSIMGLSTLPELGAKQTGESASDNLGASKKISLDLLVHESGIGLSPQSISSKGILVLTSARFSTLVPPNDIFKGTFELNKAALFLADEPTPDQETHVAFRVSPHNPATSPKLLAALSRQGYISVGSIMAAKVDFRAENDPGSNETTLDVDVRNQLLLLETCADSTQTLIAVLNGLSPPRPAGKQPKYLTEPMTIEDMMASFTGEPYEKPDSLPETIFDAENAGMETSGMDLDASTYGVDDDGLLAESEMSASLYGPISGLLDTPIPPDEADSNDGFSETVESLLEDDPFEMTSSPTETRLSDAALIREINKQSSKPVSEEAVDLGLYEIEDLGFDALGGMDAALGTENCFNNTVSTKYSAPKAGKKGKFPLRLKLRDLHVIWNIYDGYDWDRTRDGITQVVERVEAKAEERKARHRQSLGEREEEESVIGDFLFNSIYIGVPNINDAQDIRRQINRGIDDQITETESVAASGTSRPTTTYSASGRAARPLPRRRLRLERSRAHKVAFELRGVSADVLVLPSDSKDVVSSIDIRIGDFEIFDNVPTSTWRKFLTALDSGPNAREMAKPLMHVEILNVRTLENYAASELVLHISILPLRLHVDQDALDFIARFFEFKDEKTASADSGGEQPFLQRVEVETVDLKLDYKPKKIDYAGLRSGHTTEFMNFVILDAANIRLKHAIVYGIKGFEPLHKTLNDVWMPDVRRNQLPTVLAGLAPVRSLVNIGSGVRDVVAIPIQEYRKDGRIVRSIQKGAFQFGKTTTSELARLGAKVAIGTQNLLQGAEGFLSTSSASFPSRPGAGRRTSSEQGWHDIDPDDDDREHRAISAYAGQPIGVLSGLRSARRHLERDLLTAKDALIAVQGEVMESASPGDAAAAVVKHAPTIIIRPVAGVSRAVGTALLGVGNQIDRSNVRKIEDKYKRR